MALNCTVSSKKFRLNTPVRDRYFRLDMEYIHWHMFKYIESSGYLRNSNSLSGGIHFGLEQFLANSGDNPVFDFVFVLQLQSLDNFSVAQFALLVGQRNQSQHWNLSAQHIWIQSKSRNLALRERSKIVQIAIVKYFKKLEDAGVWFFEGFNNGQTEKLVVLIVVLGFQNFQSVSLSLTSDGGNLVGLEGLEVF